jgi:putative ABC transport system permease protein
MLKSYIKIAIRNLMKHKLYSIVNIAGFTIGLTACLIIGLYLWNELSFDRFNKNADRIARVTMEYSNGGTINKAAVTGTRIGPEFKRHFPEIEEFSRTIKGSRVITRGDIAFTENNILFADSAFFSIFSFPLLQGDRRSCLTSPEKVVITAQIARKYFGSEEALGKILKVSNSADMVVSGIVSDVPGNSQIHFDMVMPFMNLKAAKQEEQWFTANYVTYLMVQSPEKIKELQPKITAYMKNISRKDLFPEGNDYLTHQLEPLPSVHLHSTLDGLEPNGNIVSVYVLCIIALLILLIACVNYTNLAVAQSSGRSIEVGIRKVLGAQKKQLLFQFLGESFIITCIALFFSFLLCFFLLPFFNTLAGATISRSFLFNPFIVLFVFIIGILISLVSGLYPALILSGTQLVLILKSGLRLTSSGNGIRKTMIVFQFVVSVFLIASTIIVTGQLKYIQNKDLGYNKQQLLILPVDSKMKDHYDDLKKAISAQPGVLKVSAAYETPTYIQWSDGILAETGKEKKEISVNAIPVDFDFIETMGMQLISGRDFTQPDLLAMDTSDNYKNYQLSFILNEKAVEELGWTPEEAIGKTISKGSPGIIRGVVKNFNFSSLHEPIGPLAIFLGPDFAGEMFVRVQGTNLQANLLNLEKLWKQRIPYRPFEYKFLDEEFVSLYKTEQHTAVVFGLFSGLAILLACLGLFALAAFTTVKRTKEIGIRKVLGASIPEIVMMLSKEFLLLVSLAILIAIPISWYAGSKWLQDFAFRIDISWWMFFSAALIAVIIAFLAVSLQALKAAITNPVKALRSE